MNAKALDVGFKQCLVDFFEGDSDFNWHMRLLIHPSPLGDGRWVAATPDLEIEVIDLGKHRVVPLTRKGDIPRTRSTTRTSSTRLPWASWTKFCAARASSAR